MKAKQLELWTTRDEPCLRDPRAPTKKYIASVLESEDLAHNQDMIDTCLDGWRQAVADTNCRERARTLWRAFDRGDVWAVGYCTYASAYGPEPEAAA